ncbi:nucleoside deaminase [Thalassobacillus hwangdonensis]|uniref:Nucleoside deaminase n=1 Tax=Thalassobacillus hwangdonensis TaxID=546108 RepID=A0ABW3KUV9_9BACI
MEHEYYMSEALKEAEEAGKRGDLPVGAVIVHKHTIVARGSNKIETMDSRVAHAEMIAIQSCAAYLKKHQEECILYTTVEPCIMCLSTIVMANIRHVVFATKDHYMAMDRFIASNPYIEKRIHTYESGILEDKSQHLLKTYSPYMAEVVINGRKPALYKE